MLTLYELARALAGQVSLSDAADVIAKHLRRLIPSALCVFYFYDRNSDELEAKHVVGDAASKIEGLRMPLGQRLSGWVAANRRTISNSDASLDLADTTRPLSPMFNSSLSTAMVCDDELVGVLALYSATANAFNDDHTRIIEAVARQIARTLRSAAEFDAIGRRDPLTGLPSLRQLEQLIDAESGRPANLRTPFTLLFIDVVEMTNINTVHGRPLADGVLRHIVEHAMAGLRLADILFRSSSDEFVALLSNTSSETAGLIGKRIQDAIQVAPLSNGEGSIALDITTTAVSFPRDGESLPALTAKARGKGKHAHQIEAYRRIERRPAEGSAS